MVRRNPLRSGLNFKVHHWGGSKDLKLPLRDGGEISWALSSSSESGPSFQSMAEIDRSSTFGNSDKRINNVPWLGEISCKWRAVIDVQGNFAKDCRMIHS